MTRRTPTTAPARIVLFALLALGFGPCGGTERTVLTPLPDAAAGPFVPSSKVDVLFMIDNSPSMSPKQQALASQFQYFLTPLDLAGIDYHVGIVTSDLGAWPVTGSLSGSLGGKCDSTKGDNGALQAIPCSMRSSADYSEPGIQSLCSTVCPTPVGPQARAMPDGSLVTGNFLAISGSATNVPGNQVAQAFSCMAFVGDTGCGMEMQLEAVKRAVDGTSNPTQNAHFLRPDALLAVVLITDEDDCSVQDRTKDDPMTIDCSPGGSPTPSWACFNPDYRCFAEGARCASGYLDQAGVKSGCTPSTGSFLYDVQHYIDFFDGLKPRGGVLIEGIVSPPDGPVQIDFEDGTPPATGNLNRSLSMPACDSGMTDPITGVEIIGKPQVRLHQLIQHFGGMELSICDVHDYSTILSTLAKDMVAHLGR